MSSTLKEQSLLQGYLIEQTAKRMKQGFARELFTLKIDITVDQWIILDTLSEEDHLSQLEISNLTQKDAPTVTRILDLLEKKSVLSRTANKADRRKFVISLTAKGKKIIHKIKPISNSYRTNCYQGITQKEMKTLKTILQTISSNLQNI